MHTVKSFDHDGRKFEIKMVSDIDGWHLKVFVDGKPTKVDGSVSHEVQQDAAHYEIGDPRKVIADALEEFIQGNG